MTSDATKLTRDGWGAAEAADGDEAAEDMPSPEAEASVAVEPPALIEPAPANKDAAKPDSQRPFKVGDVLSGRYRIDGELDRGGMGAVYRGTQLVTEKPVAIKSLFLGGSRLEERKKRFLREARAAAKVRHTNVADVYDFGEHEGQLYMVMELLHGESLRSRLQRGVLGEAEAVSLFMPALRGLSAAHAQGVIHRDLKPENVFLRDAGLDVLPEAVLLDFGLSKVFDPSVSALTLEGVVLGTPQYMAPEQVEGTSAIGAQCDIYSMAVILYEAVAGRRPFLALSMERALSQLVHDDPPQLRAFAPQVSERFEQAVMRALSRKPEDRQPSVEAFARELEEGGQVPFSPGLRISSVRPKPMLEPALPDPGKPHARHPSLTAKRWAGAALLLLLAGGIFAWTAIRRHDTTNSRMPVVQPATPAR